MSETDQKDELRSERNPKLEFYRNKAGEYAFRLKAPNNKIVMPNEGYDTAQGRREGLLTIKKHLMDPKLEYINLDSEK